MEHSHLHNANVYTATTTTATTKIIDPVCMSNNTEDRPGDSTHHQGILPELPDAADSTKEQDESAGMDQVEMVRAEAEVKVEGKNKLTAVTFDLFAAPTTLFSPLAPICVSCHPFMSSPSVCPSCFFM